MASLPSSEFPVGELWDKYALNPFTGTLYIRRTGRALSKRKSARSECAEIWASGKRIKTNYGRVIFAFTTGHWPVHTVDHIDKDFRNHQPWNLRDVTQATNNNNKGEYKPRNPQMRE